MDAVIAMDAVIERMFTIYAQMMGTNKISEDLKIMGSNHVRELFEAGETDEERLTVRGLTYLKKADGSLPTQAGGNRR
jgi:hypothetical protein